MSAWATRARTVSAPAPPPVLDRWVVDRLRSGLPSLPVRLVLWNGATIDLSPGEALADVVVRDRRTLWRILRDPARFFGEAYAAGDLEIRGDLDAFLQAIFRSWAATPWSRAASRRRTRNSTVRSRANVHHHYDLGNDFYRLWLDREMVYTCAYFPDPALSLEEAQVRKMDYVCGKLRLRPGESVLEAGCGWGALALHMARRHGVRVVACNVSREQIRWARERAAREALDGRVEFVEDDYRNVSGRFDAFVSVGMLEHVGPAHYGELSRVIDRTLDPRRGRGLLHFIGRNRPGPLGPWIERRIFPGAYAPTLAEAVQGVLEPCVLSVLDVENLRLHYARTLRHWRLRFEQAADEIARRYDETFVREWRLYLASSEASFATGWLQLFQVVFARPTEDGAPWTRAGLYT